VTGDDVARALLIPSMTKRYAKRGRPPGTSGRAAVLTRGQIRHVFRVARARGRYADRAEAVFALSLGLGLRAKELAALKWTDVYEADGKVRPVIHLKAAYTKGAKTPRNKVPQFGAWAGSGSRSKDYKM
jgi:integrase